eukprot:GFUD01072167.1.p1 GENE.GFUD01072167.1~~GFUD01072167.1.p1  ORF type:complete len:250 (+),score=77.53 GFUD01072167.1:70-819(+)
MSGDRYMDSDFYNDSAYTADISTKMRMPEHLMAHGSVNGDYVNHDLDLEKTNTHLYGMQVPDRILVAGSEQHIPSKSTPRELQLEHSVMPPTPEHVRVHTPPRSITLDQLYAQEEPYCLTPDPERGQDEAQIGSIKLGDVHFPSASEEPRTPQEQNGRGTSRGPGGGQKGGLERGGSYEADTPIRSESVEGLSVYEEVQMMRRQIAKLNHRLMAVELENQQQQQREMVLTVLVSAYFVVKAMLWINKSM